MTDVGRVQPSRKQDRRSRERHRVDGLWVGLETAPRRRLFGPPEPVIIASDVVDLSVEGARLAVQDDIALPVGTQLTLGIDGVSCEVQVTRTKPDRLGEQHVALVFLEPTHAFTEVIREKLEHNASREPPKVWLSGRRTSA